MSQVPVQANEVLQVSAASEWQQTLLKKLPSGKVVELRQIDVSQFLRYGELPDFMSTMIGEILMGADKVIRDRVQSPDQVTQLFSKERDLLERVGLASIVKPKVVPSDKTPGEGEISASWLSMDDLTFILHYLMTPALTLETFLAQQDASMEPLAALEDVPNTAEPIGVRKTRRKP